jgi:hypothetical protein
MVELTVAIEMLNQARDNLRGELEYFESLSETGQPAQTAVAYASQGVANR